MATLMQHRHLLVKLLGRWLVISKVIGLLLWNGSIEVEDYGLLLDHGSLASSSSLIRLSTKLGLQIGLPDLSERPFLWGTLGSAWCCDAILKHLRSIYLIFLPLHWVFLSALRTLH
jgi:hypothetical protein